SAAEKTHVCRCFRAFIAIARNNIYIKDHVVLRPSDEALLLIRPARQARRNQPENFPLPMSPRSPAHVRRATSLLRKKRPMVIGTVKFFNTSKGFGFIAPEGGAKDVFIHASALEAAGIRSLSEGQKVSFDVQPDARGSKAANVKLV